MPGKLPWLSQPQYATMAIAIGFVTEKKRKLGASVQGELSAEQS